MYGYERITDSMRQAETAALFLFTGTDPTSGSVRGLFAA